ncbi:Spliceosome-associated protein 49 [Armadillidium nasatum]|uniref:Spliceosome-associated protein 49 n=1 Tax=Armadillidium nasatum TaxID=96803 RepID=A0A5N5SSN5_9CRUS|nr:Spliceosome-associated protein 49 [Armadillidium nasatum]
MNPERENTSLYVGDLSKCVTEEILYEKLSCVGLIESIQICRKTETKESLAYAYVNCLTKLDAERIHSAMNYEYLKGKPMRIMWVEDDPSRKSHSSNVIIKNLHKSIDTRVLFDTFSYFGKIVSCKIPTDEQGRSKSYGFIHFETEEEANLTIEKVNGKLILNKKVTVEKYKSRGEMRLKSLEEKGNAVMYNSRKGN